MKQVFNRIKTILSIVLVFLILSSCASKRYEKQAAKNEQAGLFEDAAELYLKSLEANPKNIDAKIGAKKSGQIALDRKLSEFSRAYLGGQVHTAVFHYVTAKNYSDRFASQGVIFDFPEYYVEQFNEVKNLSIEEKYGQAVQLLDNEKFAESETLLKDIISLESNYKDVKDLYRTAHYEPLYRQGKKQFETRLFRKAYYTFATIENETQGYKEAQQYKADALEAATFVVQVDNFDFRTDPRLASRLRSTVMGKLSASENPFLKIIDPTTDKSMSMQKKFESNATLRGRVIQAGVVPGKFSSIDKKGYLKRTYEETDKATGQKTTKVVYDKIMYKEFSQENSANVVFTYQLVATTSGEVLLSDEISLNSNDEMHYATYEGDSKNIYPGFWKTKTDSKEDVVNTSYGDFSELQKLFSGKKTIKSTDQLMTEILEQIALKSSGAVIRYNPEEK